MLLMLFIQTTGDPPAPEAVQVGGDADHAYPEPQFIREHNRIAIANVISFITATTL